MGQSLVTIRMDDNLKKQFDYVCNELGMNISTAVTIFAKQVCRDGCIPFEISLGKNYKEENRRMKQQVVFEVMLYPEVCCTDECYNIKESFSVLEDAIDFLERKQAELLDTLMDSDIDELKRSAVWFAINIMYLDEHSHVVSWSDCELRYCRDDVEEAIEYSDELVDEDGYLSGLIHGYIKGLMR